MTGNSQVYTLESSLILATAEGREKRFSKCKDSDVTRVNLELGSLQVICAPAESSR